MARLTLAQFAVKLLAVTLVALKAVGAAGVSAAVAVGVGVAVAVGVAVGVGVGELDCAQYLLPVLKWTLLVFAPPQTIISLPVQITL